MILVGYRRSGEISSGLLKFPVSSAVGFQHVPDETYLILSEDTHAFARAVELQRGELFEVTGPVIAEALGGVLRPLVGLQQLAVQRVVGTAHLLDEDLWEFCTAV